MGVTTDGWHWSRTVHHGTTARARVENGVLILEANPFGQGGLLLTDKIYRDFELYLEALPDPGFNSGIFLRSSEGGSAYQLELVRPGNTGALLGEQMRVTSPEYIGERTDINTVWKDGEWNSMRIRMVGEAPHMTLWINDTKMWEVRTPQERSDRRRLRGPNRTAAALDRDVHGGGRRPFLRASVARAAFPQHGHQGDQLMRRAALVLVSVSAGAAGLLAQSPTMTNSIGMEFVLIQPGSMVVGRFEPPYPTPPDPNVASRPAASRARGLSRRPAGGRAEVVAAARR